MKLGENYVEIAFSGSSSSFITQRSLLSPSSFIQAWDWH